MINLERMQDLEDPDYSQEWRVYYAAIEYINAGIRVVPLRPNQKILPSSDTNINYGAASRSEKVITGWFDPSHGRFKGWNIGIACGKIDGVWALDIDTHGDHDGWAELRGLESAHETLPPGPRATTPNNGQHILFRWQEGAASSTGKIAKALDSRGGTEKVCKSHIAVFPSIVNEKMYKWTDGGEIPHIPRWLVESMGIAWRKPKPMGKGNEEVGEADLEALIPVTQVEAMLKFIDIDMATYEEWVQIGQAINSQYPNDTGLKLWGQWSAKGQRFKEGECSSRWPGFNPMGPVRAGTLYHHARAGGWTPEPSDVAPSEIDELVGRMNKEFALVMVGGKIRILKERSHVHDPMMGYYDLMNQSDFKVLLANKIQEFQVGKKIVRTCEADLWLAHQERRTYENGLGLFPTGAPTGYYNTWHGYGVEPRKGNCTLFWSHIHNVICRGNEEHIEWLVDWMADAVQDPAHPKGCAIVMKGTEGTGKGTFADTFGRLFGSHYRHLIDDSHLTSNFNAHMMDALMVFADEITWGGNKKSSGKLKGIVTEEWAMGERKGVDAIQYRNMVHLIIASNSEWVIPAGPQSRRWMVLDIDPARRSDSQYFQPIYHQLSNGGREALLYDLLERKITSKLTRAPETEELGHQRTLNYNRDSVVEWWCECVSQRFLDVASENELGEEEAWPKLADRMYLHKGYVAWCKHMGSNPISAILFYRAMDKFGVNGTTRPGKRNTKGRRILLRMPSIYTSKAILKADFGIDVSVEGDEE